MKATALTAATGGLVLALCATSVPTRAQAQDERVTLNILRECAKISDVMGRVACYDRNIGVDVAQPAQPPLPTGFGANQVPPRGPAPAIPPLVAPAPADPRGFGANQLVQPEAPRATSLDAISARVAAARQLAPGVYVLTLEDGAQWQFVDAASPSFDPPGKGATVEFFAASMGSYLLRYRGQRGIRIRRIK